MFFYKLSIKSDVSLPLEVIGMLPVEQKSCTFEMQVPFFYVSDWFFLREMYEAVLVGLGSRGELSLRSNW